MTNLSKFQGVIAELPHITVDYFINVNGVAAYFLSHCHAGMRIAKQLIILFKFILFSYDYRSHGGFERE